MDDRVSWLSRQRESYLVVVLAVAVASFSSLAERGNFFRPSSSRCWATDALSGMEVHCAEPNGRARVGVVRSSAASGLFFRPAARARGGPCIRANALWGISEGPVTGASPLSSVSKS